MGVEFNKDSANEDRWRVYDPEEDVVIHACHEGFSSKHNALTNLFINHTMMSMWVRATAQGKGYSEEVTFPIFGTGYVTFEDDKKGKVRWQLKSTNGEIVGASHKGFETKSLAADNLIMTYTMLAMYIAQHALDKVGK